MNIFTIEYAYNSTDIGWIESAESQDNLRLNKMITETAQILSTALHNIRNREHLESDIKLYKSTHVNHPSCLYARASYESFQNVLLHGLSLYEEYDFRFSKSHKSGEVIKYIRDSYVNFADLYLPHIAVDFSKYMAIPDKYRISSDPVECYRSFYANKPLLRYKKDQMPQWVSELREPSAPSIVIIS